MDHLPAPRDAGASIRVPHLGVIPYDLSEGLTSDAALDHFKLFPDRHGFGQQGTILRGLDPLRLATVVQSWLYFGLISAFFNTHLDLADFTATEPSDDPSRQHGLVYVTSAHLNTLLKRLDEDEWNGLNEEQEAYSEEREETDRHRRAVLRERRKALSVSRAERRELRKDLCNHSRDVVRSFDEQDVEKSPELAAICLSIQLLTITLLGCNPTKDPSRGWSDDDNVDDDDDDSSSDRGEGCPWRMNLVCCIFDVWLYLEERLDRLVVRIRAHLGSYSATRPAKRDINYPSYCLDLSHWESDLLRSTMVRNGWCRSDLDHIFASQDLLTIYYLSQIRRHPILSSSHTQCTREECFAINSPSKPPYHRSHTIDLCQCRDICVDTDRLCRIIEDGDIPLVYVEPAGHGTFRLRLTRMGSLSEYVAISHVWSDGLGNPDANSLFQCELESLMDSFIHIPVDRYTRLRTLNRRIRMVPEYLASKLLSRGGPIFRKQLFWMDTLCIPVTCATDPPDRVARINALKQRAIKGMNMVYYGATHVVILDAELRNRSLTGTPKVSRLGAFNTRVWSFTNSQILCS